MKQSKSIIVNGLKYGIAIFGVVLLILNLLGIGNFPKILSYIATILLPFAPMVIRKIGLKFTQELEIAYYLFLIPSMLFGIDLDMYKAIECSDKIVHTMSGIFTAFVARELILQASIKTGKLWFKIFFNLAFVAFIAVLWECFEFSCDQLMGQRMQNLLNTGNGVEDTMWDMIVAMLGGLGTTTYFAIKNMFKA